MNDRDALLAATLVNPEDNAPLLVLADWFDENGQSDQAEAIRLGCNPRHRDGRTREGLRYQELIQRVLPVAPINGNAMFRLAHWGQSDWRLSAEGRDPVSGGLPAQLFFDRGLARRYVGRAEDWIGLGDEILARHPGFREAWLTTHTYQIPSRVVGRLGSGSRSLVEIAGKVVSAKSSVGLNTTLEYFRARWPGPLFLNPHQVLRAANRLRESRRAEDRRRVREFELQRL
jgi:uncharacterized protein (TIGR02996 family)